MKKNWKIIVGAIFLIGGFGCIDSDMGAAVFGVVVGAIFIIWWILGRKRIMSRDPAVAGKSYADPTEHPQIVRPAQSLNQTSPADYKFSIEISGFGADDDEYQNLDFYRDKLNSKKALTTFDTYVVLDCETSGFSPKTDEIIEIALAKYVNGELVETFSTLIAPSSPIPARITELTGITNAELEGAPTVQAVIPKVWTFIDGFTLVGHNIPFDIGFLKVQFSKNGYEGRFNYVDTLQLARAAFPSFPNHKLSTCIDELSLSDKQTHRAMDDVICTQRLLEKCLPVLLKKKEQELAERRANKASAIKE